MTQQSAKNTLTLELWVFVPNPYLFTARTSLLRITMISFSL